MEKYGQTLQWLREWNEDELFYRDYLRAKESPEELKRFLTGYTEEEIRRRRLICPELVPFEVSVLEERWFFERGNRRNIWVEKHNRFSPVFLHRHEYFEIFYVFSGSCRQRIRGEETVLPQGTLCLLAPYEEHSMAVFDESIVLNIFLQRTTFDDLFFDVLRVPGVLSRFFLSNLAGSGGMSHLYFQADDPELRELLLSMVEEERSEDAFTYRVLNSLMNLFFVKLARRWGDTAVFESPKGDGRGMEIIRYISDHYRSVTLEETAEHFGYSLAYCSRLIRAATGRTFTQLLRDIRMRRAETLLLTTPASLETISWMVGYENAGTFIRLFRQAYGMTPGAFRKEREQLPPGLEPPEEPDCFQAQR